MGSLLPVLGKALRRGQALLEFSSWQSKGQETGLKQIYCIQRVRRPKLTGIKERKGSFHISNILGEGWGGRIGKKIKCWSHSAHIYRKISDKRGRWGRPCRSLLISFTQISLSLLLFCPIPPPFRPKSRINWSGARPSLVAQFPGLPNPGERPRFLVTGIVSRKEKNIYP